MYSLSNKFPVQTDSIIIVHPQSRIRSLLRRVISMEGYKVFEAVDSHDAAAIARQEDVGMILCDKESNGLDDLSPDRKRTLFPYADILSLPLADATREDAQLLLSVISHTLKKMQHKHSYKSLLNQQTVSTIPAKYLPYYMTVFRTTTKASETITENKRDIHFERPIFN